MTKRFVNNFIAADLTPLETYNPLFAKDATWVSGSNGIDSVIFNNQLCRPSAASQSQLVSLFSGALTVSETPNINDYEVVTDFSVYGTTTVGNNVGAIARASTANNGYFCRYRANTGYQLFKTTSAATTQIGTTYVSDVNPTVSFASPMRRRVRLKVVGSSIGVYVDTYSSGTWTVGETAVISATDSTYTSGLTGIWYSSPNMTVASPSDGIRINEWYIEDLQSSVPVTPVITSSLTASGNVNSAFTYSIVATNSPTSFGATGLPAGISINSVTGVISGTPTVQGSSSVTITATNSAGTDTETLVITVNAAAVSPPVITSSLTASGVQNTSFSYSIIATNSPTSFGVTGLPAGLSLNVGTGVISGTPTGASVTNVSISATNSAGTDTETLVISIAVAPTQNEPGAPTGLSVRVFSPLSTEAPLNNSYMPYSDTLKNLVHLQWVAPSVVGASPISGYTLQGSPNGSSGWVTLANTGNFLGVNSIAKPEGNYFFRVAAVNSFGEGTYSNVLSVAGNNREVIGNMAQVNGCWTFFTHPVAVSYRGATYIGSINNAGTALITKVIEATGESTSFDLENLSAVRQQYSGSEIDDHDNPAIFIREDGRIACYYGAHNDPAGIRYRISLLPENITSWSPAAVFSPVNGTDVTLPTCYSNPRNLKGGGILMYHFRTGTPPNAPHAVLYANTSNDLKINAGYPSGAGFIKSTQSPWTSQRPYVQSVNNGEDRVDFLTTDGHPDDPGTANNGNGTSLYHFYVRWINGNIKYFKSDGVEITSALPLRPKISGGGSDITQIWNGVNIRGWSWDIQIWQGQPWVLFTTYDNGLGNFGFSNQRYMFSRWNGTTWITSDITGSNVASLGSPIRGVACAFPGLSSQGVNGSLDDQDAYTGGICFDSQDPRIVYLSNPVLQTTTSNPDLTVNDPFPIREIQEWRTSDLGLTWTKTRDITKNSPPNIINFRPVSPLNHRGKASVVWLRGTYMSYVRGFNSNIWYAPSSSQELPSSELTPLSARMGISRTGQLMPYIL